jgi:hypothetical protein
MIINDSGIWVDGIQIFDDSSLDLNYNQTLNATPARKAGINIVSTVSRALLLGVTVDSTMDSIIPPGYLIKYVIVNNAGSLPAQLSAGSVAGGNDIFSSEPIRESGITVIKPEQAFSFTDFTSIYFNHAGDSDTWNGQTLDFYLTLEKI